MPSQPPSLVPRYHFLSNHFHHTMKSREYCCCAIPMVNAGIYATLIEQLVAGVLIGALAFSTPPSTYLSDPSNEPNSFQSSALHYLHFLRRCLGLSASLQRQFNFLVLLVLPRCAAPSISFIPDAEPGKGEAYSLPSLCDSTWNHYLCRVCNSCRLGHCIRYSSLNSLIKLYATVLPG